MSVKEFDNAQRINRQILYIKKGFTKCNQKP